MSPQGFVSTYAPRLRCYANSLLCPASQNSATQSIPGARTTKRGTTAINYAEDGYDDDDFDDLDGPRRQTGLRSLRREAQSQDKLVGGGAERVGKELTAPADVQGIWRDWMTRGRLAKADKQLSVQTLLPLTLIPIRIELDVPSFTPPPPFPVPHNPLEFGVDPSLPAYRTPEMTASFRLRDVFLWNLHETLITPDSFAMTLVNDLDLPHPVSTAAQISSQIRQQLEEYAGVALHPLFHETIRDGLARDGAWRAGGATQKNGGAPSSSAVATNSDSVVPEATATAESEPINSPDDIYRCIITLNINLLNKLYTDKFEWSLLHRPGAAEQFARLTCADIGLSGEWIPAIAHAIYEAVLRLRKEACESGGLIAALLNSISEGSVGGGGGGANGGVNGTGIEIENMAADAAAAGWRFDNEQLGEEWGPKVELLSKEEIEKREGDRERQIRRVRRETARFSSNAGMASFFKILGAGPVTSNNPSAGGGGDSGGGGNSRVGTPVPLGGGAGAGAGAGASEMDVDTNDSNNGNNNYNNQPGTPGPPAAAAPGQVPATTGRPERGKKKRRFRSLSPVGRSGSISGGGGGAGGFLGVSGGRGTPDLAMFGAVGSTGGYGGGLGGLSEWERHSWRCAHCFVWGSNVWAVRDGPIGTRTLCNSCALVYERDKSLPWELRGLHRKEVVLR